MKLLGTAKKSLGQNFLIDNNIINKIIKISDINKNKIVMEIGAGYGNLTKSIVSMGPKKVFAIEEKIPVFKFTTKILCFCHHFIFPTQ